MGSIKADREDAIPPHYAQRAAQRANHARRISGHKEIKFAEAFQQITPVVLKEFR